MPGWRRYGFRDPGTAGKRNKFKAHLNLQKLEANLQILFDRVDVGLAPNDPTSLCETEIRLSFPPSCSGTVQCSHLVKVVRLECTHHSRNQFGFQISQGRVSVVSTSPSLSGFQIREKSNLSLPVPRPALDKKRRKMVE